MWLAWPPALLRTGPCLSSGRLSRFWSTSLDGLVGPLGPLERGVRLVDVGLVVLVVVDASSSARRCGARARCSRREGRAPRRPSALLRIGLRQPNKFYSNLASVNSGPPGGGTWTGLAVTVGGIVLGLAVAFAITAAARGRPRRRQRRHRPGPRGPARPRRRRGAHGRGAGAGPRGRLVPRGDPRRRGGLRLRLRPWRCRW